MNQEPLSSAAFPGAPDGTIIGAEDLARLAERTLNEIAAGLECRRLIVLAYSPHDNMLRGVRTVGFEAPDLHNLHFALSSFSAADQALRTHQIRPIAAVGSGLP